MSTSTDHLERARAVSERAYAPYSRYHVGACLLSTSGAVYDGVNVENASYGGTICAERMALGAAVTAEGPSMRLRQVTVFTTTSPPAAPCGLCLQVISEFCATDTRVVCGNHKGEVRIFSFGNLLPQAFHGHEITPAQD
jgi:cytidine deaminase